MAVNDNKKKDSCSETIPFDVTKFSKLQYIKLIYVGTDNELYEISTTVQTFNNTLIQLYSDAQNCAKIYFPMGIVLKIVTADAIYFAKTILKDIKKINTKNLFIMDAPKKTIRQQKRKHCRVNINRPCVLLINDNKGGHQSYLTQSVNISMGGVLLCNTESMLKDEKVNLNLYKDDVCNIVMFIEQDLIVKVSAKFVRAECIDDLYRYAFQFLSIPIRYMNPLDKYLTNAQFKLLKNK